MKTLPPPEKRQALLPIHLAAQRTFLQQGAKARLQAARILQLWAQDPGLELADPASVHGIALLSVLFTPQDDSPLAEPGVQAGAQLSFFPARKDSRQISPAALFFAETILLLEKSQSVLDYRIAQEALSNVVRHAKATHASLTITAEAGLIRMEIRDDGQGFKATDALAAERPAGIGLLVMRERAAMAGGTLTIDSAPGHTTVRVEVPSQPLAHAPTFANP